MNAYRLRYQVKCVNTVAQRGGRGRLSRVDLCRLSVDRAAQRSVLLRMWHEI